MPIFQELWQETAWDGVMLQLPRNWQPTVVHKSYLFFEQEGEPAFAIKWEQVRGRFSAHRILDRLQHSLQPSHSVLRPWNMREEMPETAQDFSATGFQYQHGAATCLGILLFCPRCRRATLLQHYTTDAGDRNILHHILQSFRDHHNGPERLWSMYDIRARLPAKAELQSHEFLAGRYTLSFTLEQKNIRLYRFKPAAALLNDQSLQEFGALLAGDAVCIDNQNNRIATWEFTASGFDRLAALLGRKSGWIWLQLRIIEEKNAILAVKGEGSSYIDRQLLQHITENFTVGEAV
ncbi:MAG: hypothetical protein SCH71_01570 [Desulfobulbaceae bacterium]|nr:hypothetical protein [Desulfobulbaceae bacterium]